jgi:hypothetical protein
MSETLSKSNTSEVKPHIPELGPVLDELSDLVGKLVVFEDPYGPDATVMWLCHNRAFRAARYNPILVSTNDEEGAGKTRLLSVVKAGSSMPKVSANPSAAWIYRSKAGQSRTFILDEADTGFFDRDEVAGLINAAWTKEFAKTGRAGSKDDGFASEDLSLWHCYAFGMIGLKLKPSTKRRCWILRTKKLNRKSPEYATILKRGAEAKALARIDELGLKLHTLLKPYTDPTNGYLVNAEPVIPDEIEEPSVEDNVTLMLAVCEMAGDAWAQRARDVAVKMSNPARSTGSDALSAMEVALRWFDLHQEPLIATQTWYQECVSAGVIQKFEVSEYAFSQMVKPLRPERKPGRAGRKAGGRGYLRQDIERLYEERMSPPLEAEEKRERDKDNVVALPRAA